MMVSRSKRCSWKFSEICHLEHRGLAAAGAEKRKHVDRTVDRPLNILVDQIVEVVELALVDRAMQRARETPETVLCHCCLPKSGLQTATAFWGVIRRRAVAALIICGCR
jgi:hypothetical protein